MFIERIVFISAFRSANVEDIQAPNGITCQVGSILSY